MELTRFFRFTSKNLPKRGNFLDGKDPKRVLRVKETHTRIRFLIDPMPLEWRWTKSIDYIIFPWGGKNGIQKTELFPMDVQKRFSAGIENRVRVRCQTRATHMYSNPSSLPTTSVLVPYSPHGRLLLSAQPNVRPFQNITMVNLTRITSPCHLTLWSLAGSRATFLQTLSSFFRVPPATG